MTTRPCYIWIYGPQVSDTNRAYAVGGTLWMNTYNGCALAERSLYKLAFLPNEIYRKMSVDTPGFVTESVIYLNKCTKVTEILLLHSALINTYGWITVRLTNLIPSALEKLFSIYDEVHKVTELMVKENINIFLTPTQFRDLGNSKAKRPKNIAKEYPNLDLLNGDIPVFPTPSTTTMNQIHKMFEKVENPIFKPLVEEISYNYNLLQKKVPLLKEDIISFKKHHRPPAPTSDDKKPPIVIRKKANTYLSQLFEKTCILFYKPCEIKPKTTSNEEDFRTAVKQNLLILLLKCGGYATGNLTVFNTPIGEKVVGTEIESNVPVFFLKDDNTVEFEYDIDTSIEFFTGVLQDMLDLNVFVKIENTDRYEINDKFDVETLECYKALPADTKTPQLKKEVAEYFTLFVGNIIHFAVTNHIKMPFKLSWVYLAIIFKLFVFVIISRENTILLITMFLFEKAGTEFQKEILKIFEDPSSLQTSRIRMNGHMPIVTNDNNRQLYNADPNVLFDNVIEYVYKIAVAKYFSDFGKTFFKGFNYTKQFDSNSLYEMDCMKPQFIPPKPKEQQLELLVKGDLYLSGGE